ncbi:hypothetical protein BKA62DRAFT_618106, partial [Auriculariales sp. MPI-PUGE-AT-0066]
MALRAATEHAQAYPEVTRIVLFSDCSAAVNTIHNPKPRAGQKYAILISRLALEFLDQDPTHSVEIEWCPGHSNIDGNKCADRLAREGA